MTQPDPARARWFSIQGTRILGVAFVIGGLLIVNKRFDLPMWVGALFIVNGLVDVFVLPILMARKWRSKD